VTGKIPHSFFGLRGFTTFKIIDIIHLKLKLIHVILYGISIKLHILINSPIALVVSYHKIPCSDLKKYKNLDKKRLRRR